MEYPLKDLRYEVTTLCNQGCLHCMVDAGQKDIVSAEISEDELIRIIQDALPLGLEKFSFTGGEPLLEMRKVIVGTQYCTRNNIYTRLFTNGTLLTRALMERLNDAGMKEILVSIDGIGATHDSFRGSVDSFRLALDALRLLKDYPDIVSGARLTITSHNYHEIPNLIEKYLLPLNLTRINVRPFCPCGRGRLNMDYMLKPDQHKTVFKHLAKLQKTERINFVGNCYAFLHNGEDKQCTCGRTQGYLNSHGNLKPCAYFPIVLGDCKRQGIKAIWKSKHPALDALRNPTAPDKCVGCEHYMNPCQGGCYASAYSVFRSVRITDPTCPVAGVK